MTTEEFDSKSINSDTPLVSVIMNCYNGEKYLQCALNSVLAQSYTNWELVFWDNQSTDKSAEIFKNYDDPRFKCYYATEHTLLSKARNCAISFSKGEFIAFLDVDDWWEPEKLTKQIEAVLNTKASLVYSGYFFENTIKNKRKIVQAVCIKKNKSAFNELSRYSAGMLTLLIRKSSYHEIGGFNENYHLIGDHDLVLRMSHKYTVFGIDQPLAHYRWHGNNESIKNVDSRVMEIQRMLHEYQNDNLYPENGLKNIKDGLLYLQIIVAMNQNKRILAVNYLCDIRSKRLLLKALIRIVLPKKIINIFGA